MPEYTYNNPGDVAYNIVDVSKQFQAINYIEIYDIFRGSVFVFGTSDFEICNTEHMVSLYIEIPSTYSIEVPGKSHLKLLAEFLQHFFYLSIIG